MTVRDGLILYGPPASGKDTISKVLCDADPRFSLYRRLKRGSGRTEGYEMIEAQQVERLRQSGAIVWEVSRYDATYFFEKPGIERALRYGIPILHLGQPEGVEAVRMVNAEWTVVEVTCPIDIALQRLMGRGSTDINARLTVWADTPSLAKPDLRIDTSKTSPAESARMILERFPLDRDASL